MAKKTTAKTPRWPRRKVGVSLAKAETGRLWFRSPQYLRDITDACDFYLKESGFFWWRRYKLYATMKKKREYPYTGYYTYNELLLGVYDDRDEADDALRELQVLVCSEDISGCAL